MSCNCLTWSGWLAFEDHWTHRMTHTQQTSSWAFRQGCFWEVVGGAFKSSSPWACLRELRQSPFRQGVPFPSSSPHFLHSTHTPCSDPVGPKKSGWPPRYWQRLHWRLPRVLWTRCRSSDPPTPGRCVVRPDPSERVTLRTGHAVWGVEHCRSCGWKTWVIRTSRKGATRTMVKHGQRSYQSRGHR